MIVMIAGCSTPINVVKGRRLLSINSNRMKMIMKMREY
jgi:hypothetical protein